MDMFNLKDKKNYTESSYLSWVIKYRKRDLNSIGVKRLSITLYLDVLMIELFPSKNILHIKGYLRKNGSITGVAEMIITSNLRLEN